MKMIINYDKQADALYIEFRIEFRKGKFARNKKVDDFTIIDLDEKDNLLGIEILKASERIPSESLSEVHVKNMIAVT